MVPSFPISPACLFAATAPEPPHWFKPKMESEPRPPDPRHYYIVNDDDLRLVKSWIRDPCFDLSEPKFAGFVRDYESYKKDHMEWWREYEVQRIIQWKAYFANRMVEVLCVQS